MMDHPKWKALAIVLSCLSVSVVATNAFHSVSSPLTQKKSYSNQYNNIHNPIIKHSNKKTTTLSTGNNSEIKEDDDYQKNNIVQSAMTTKVDDNEDDDDTIPTMIPRGGNDVTKPPPEIPNLAAFRKFALPCLGLWVSQPLLSLVDTSFVGLSGDAATSANQLASLGPATTFFDGATYLFAFLNVATTNLYSSARAQSGEASDKAESVVRTASKVAFNCGVGLMMFLLAFSRPLLALYIGPEATATPGLLDSAVDYVKIRAFSMPTSLLLGVVQAALLGAKDSVTPLIAILYSTIVNVIGDFILVNRLKMGLRGAAIATLAAQLVATFALLGPARNRLVRDGSLGIFRNKKKKTTSTEATPSDAVSSKSFLGFAAPVLTLILGKLAAFGFMTHAAAAVPGQPTPLASHQIILSLFFFVSPFMEVISQTAQTFIPPYLAPINDYIEQRQKEQLVLQPQNNNVTSAFFDPTIDPTVIAWKSAAFAVATKLLRIGFVSAIIVASLSSLVPAFFANTLTTDGVVQQAVKPLAKYLWAGAFLTAPVAVAEGVLLANRDLKYLALVYVVSTALLPPILLQVKKGGTVVQVWACFAAFQLFRASCFTGKVWGGAVWNKIKTMFGGSSGPDTTKPVEATA